MFQATTSSDLSLCVQLLLELHGYYVVYLLKLRAYLLAT